MLDVIEHVARRKPTDNDEMFLIYPHRVNVRDMLIFVISKWDIQRSKSKQNNN